MVNFSAHLQDHSILRSLPSESTNLTGEERGVLKQAGGFSFKKKKTKLKRIAGIKLIYVRTPSSQTSQLILHLKHFRSLHAPQNIQYGSNYIQLPYVSNKIERERERDGGRGFVHPPLWPGESPRFCASSRLLQNSTLLNSPAWLVAGAALRLYKDL